ncbi:MAG: hypothetical protein PHR82_07510 [Endomicrobiaceae bacterium]|nr:hypothetical protein [Endomicrobiaceae bacterium]
MLKKILLIFCGLIIGLVFLELFLQSTSVAIKLHKKHIIKQELNKKKSITILCIGESTTDRQWPKFLKQSLMAKNVKKEITVIDKGVRSTNTTCILDNIESYILQFKPDIIVSMMGINDGNSDVIGLKQYKFKTQQLFFLLKQHFVKDRGILKKGNDNFHENAEFYAQWKYANDLFDKQQYGESIKILLKIFKQNQKYDIRIIKLLTRSYIMKAYELGYETPDGRKNILQAEKFVIEGIKIEPYYDINAMLFVFSKNKNRSMIEKLFPINNTEIFKKLYSQDPWAFISHTHLFFKLGMNDFVKAISSQLYNVDVKDSTIYADRVLGSNATLLIESKNYDLAEKYLQLTKNYLVKNIILETLTNYQKLAQICKLKGIKLVAMQYPMRPVNSLEQILDSYPDVAFISNEKNFKEVLKIKKIDDIFKDLFAGDFGHCTDLGNQMIADNLADTLVKLIN